jgi:branched-subunit amino acid ABC-type transport system permease component
VVGGLTLGVLEFVVLMFIKPEYQNIIALSVLIVVLLLRPQGIIGKTESLTV